MAQATHPGGVPQYRRDGRPQLRHRAASRHHYGQSAHALSREQAALLAAILPNPRKYRISNPSAYISERQAWILEQMELLGGSAYLQEIL